MKEKVRKYPTISRFCDEIIENSFYSHAELLERCAIEMVYTDRFEKEHLDDLEYELKVLEVQKERLEKQLSSIEYSIDEKEKELDQWLMKMKANANEVQSSQFDAAFRQIESTLLTRQKRRLEKGYDPFEEKYPIRAVYSIARNYNVNPRKIIERLDDDLLEDLEGYDALKKRYQLPS